MYVDSYCFRLNNVLEKDGNKSDIMMKTEKQHI